MLKVNEHYVLKEVAGEFMLVYQDASNVDFSKVITLNELGVLIFKAVGEGKNEEDIVAAILKEYDIDEETVRKDVTEFVKKLKELEIIINA